MPQLSRWLVGGAFWLGFLASCGSHPKPPPPVAVVTKDSVVVVGDQALIARGKLPPLHEGGPAFTRGLMVGVPGGLSFEFRIDDVRLLAVRNGAFVDRPDSTEGGDRLLRPLGEIVEEFGDRGPWVFGVNDQGERMPVQLALKEANVREQTCNLTLTQSNPSARLRAGVDIQLGPATGDSHAGWWLSTTIFNEWSSEIIVNLDDVSWSPPSPAELDLECDLIRWPANVEFVFGEPSSGARVPGSQVSLDPLGWIVVKHGTGFDAIHHTCLGDLFWRLDARGWAIVQLMKGTPAGAVGGGIIPHADIEWFQLAEWSPELLARMSR